MRDHVGRSSWLGFGFVAVLVGAAIPACSSGASDPDTPDVADDSADALRKHRDAGHGGGDAAATVDSGASDAGATADATGTDAAVVDSGATDSGGGGTVDSGGGGGGGVTFNTCASPQYVLATNPSNPQDGITLGGYYVDTDTWNFASYPGSKQTMYVCNYDDWYAIDNVSDTSNDGAVKTYPNVHMDYSGQAVSSFTGISSTYAHTAPSTGAWDYAYDIWLNGYGTELMIWTQSAGRQAHVPGITKVATVTLDGITYDVHHSGGYTAYDMPTTKTSGTINVLHVMQDMISRGYLSASAPLNSIQYGVEVCDTGGVDTRFEVNNFSVTAH